MYTTHFKNKNLYVSYKKRKMHVVLWYSNDKERKGKAADKMFLEGIHQQIR